MSSIMTNASAMTALKTLNATNKNLEKTQSHISTGYRVAEASDNAAYWSISTTMRSDNKALSTVNDALGLGSSTVDVAYTALNSSKDVLDAIKTKLVAAKQPGVDKSKVQSEISQLQDQLKGIASAASFSGNNWLSVDSSKSSYNAVQQVVSSFSRGDGGALSVGTIGIDISKISLFDAAANTGSGATLKGVGLLEQGLGNVDAGTLAATGSANATATAGAAAKAGTWTSAAAFTYSAGDADAGAKFNISVAVNGASADALSLTIADPSTFTLDTLVSSLNANGTFGGKASAANIDGKLVITSKTPGATSAVAVSAVSITKSGGGSSTATTNVGSGSPVTVAGAAATKGTAAMSGTFSSPITLDSDDTLSFDVSYDGGNAQTITIDKTKVNTALSSSDGTISNATQLKTVLNSVMGNNSVDVVNGKIVFSSTGTAGAGSSVAISNVKASNGGNSYGVMDIDVTKSGANLDDYIASVDKMSSNVTTAASDLGAVKSRISMQTDFVKNLMNAIDRGVGTLVDADMNEESTKLQALQVQQQLGIQALSMANSSAQSILSLFRG